MRCLLRLPAVVAFLLITLPVLRAAEEAVDRADADQAARVGDGLDHLVRLAPDQRNRKLSIDVGSDAGGNCGSGRPSDGL